MFKGLLDVVQSASGLASGLEMPRYRQEQICLSEARGLALFIISPVKKLHPLHSLSSEFLDKSHLEGSSALYLIISRRKKWTTTPKQDLMAEV
jgi:hypothetical protein